MRGGRMRYALIQLGECGEKTCICAGGLEKGYCNFLRVRNGGVTYVCELFHKELRDENGILSGPGWLQRLQPCLDAEKEANA